MRIAILAHYATWALEGQPGYRPDPQRHPTSWVMNLVRGLTELGGHDVHVVTQTDEIERDMTVAKDGVTLHFVRCPRRFRAATLFQFDRQRLKRALDAIAPGIVHAFGTEDCYGLAGLTSGYPCVMTMQCLQFKIAETLPPARFSRNRLTLAVERWCIRRARHLIGMSTYGAEGLRPVAPHAHIHEVPNAVDPLFFRAAGKPEPDRLFFAGVIERRKGLEYLVDALARVREQRPAAKLAIGGVPGRGAEAYFASVRKQIETKGLTDAVEFLGFLRPENIAREMARASVVVVPSLEEMFCNVAAEAMAVGRPVVASRVAALPQLVDDEVTGVLTPPADAVALAQAIVPLLADETRCASLGAAARNKAHCQWRPAEVARQTTTIYQLVLADNVCS
jgi:L-malate glycosyltransferase